jgi:ABC-type uncharacterized transport system involved in gliding motility auxiliary subunit
MQLGSLVAFGLLVCSALALTTLSSNNCPSDFDVATANVTGASLSAAVDFLYKDLYSSSEQAEIQAAFTSGNSTKVSKQVTTLSILIPFAIIAVAFLVTFVIAACCCIFEKSCPPCKSWKRDFATRPY